MQQSAGGMDDLACLRDRLHRPGFVVGQHDRDQGWRQVGEHHAQAVQIHQTDVVGSRMIASPLHLLDCALDTDGGYALVLASAEVAQDCAKKPVWVLGGAESVHTDFYGTIDDPWFPPSGQSVSRSAEIAFGQAGLDHGRKIKVIFARGNFLVFP